MPHTIDVETYNQWGFPRTIEPARSIDQVTFDANSEAVAFLTLVTSSEEDVRIAFDRDSYATGNADLARFGRSRRWPRLEARTNGAERRAFAFVVPAGAYALESVTIGRRATTFCLGTTVVSLPAGAVVDLGHFVVEAGGEIVDQYAPPPLARLRVDVSAADAPRRALLGNPTLSDRLQSAAYENDFPRVCSLFTLTYGIEIPGAPPWSGTPR